MTDREGHDFALVKGMKLLKLLLAIATVASIQACGKKKPSAEEACHFQQNGYLQRVSWNKKAPVTIYANTTLQADHISALQAAMEVWNQAFANMGPNKIAFIYGGVIDAQVGKVDGRNIVSLTSDWKSDPKDQAETLLAWSDNQILDADIQINGTKALSTASAAITGKIDLMALIVHELGHVLGLVHIETSEYTVMAPTLNTADVKRRNLGDLEIDAISCEY